MAIQIGCDPEFLLMKGNSRINIADSFSRSTAHGDIGGDHGFRVGELRPKHGHPKDVTSNICALVLKLKNDVNRHADFGETVKMVAGGGGELTTESIGGHIHISGLNFSMSNFSKSRMMSHEDRLILALDFFVGRRLKRVPGGKRASSNYGQPSDVRSQSWGIEYRTPPSWLSEPKLTESTLAITYLVCKIWSVKPMAFDELLNSRKMARKMDYAKLIPEDGPDSEYFTTQIVNFKSIIFDKTYNMCNKNCFETWEQGVTAVTASIKRAIELKICQVKVVQSHNGSMESEIVSKVCQFVTEEIKVFETDSIYAPYTLRRNTKRSALRTNTIYISKELRPYLKISRELGVRVRFIDFIDRDRTHIPHAFMFTTIGTNKDMHDVVDKIVTLCVRKKMRSNDE